MNKPDKLYLNFTKKFKEFKNIKALSREVLNNINAGIAIYKAADEGEDFIFQYINKAAEKIDKIKKKDIVGKSIKEVFPGVAEFGLLETLKKVYETGKARHRSVSFYKDERISGWRENYIFKLPSEEIVAIYEDLTRQKQTEETIKICEEKYKDLFENSLDGIYQSTIRGKYIDANPALVKMLGYNSKDDLIRIDIPTQIYVHKEDRPKSYNRNKVFETKLKKKDGSVIDTEISSKVIYKSDGSLFYQGIVRDITERKKFEEKLKFLSFHDKLTGLYNRAYFEEELKRLDTKRQLPLSVIIADVNGLKLINDAFGHKEGDLLLCNCSRIFEKCFRKEDIIARWGGDEFAMLLPRTTELEANNIKERIVKECRKSKNQKIPISISLGSSTKTTVSKDINTVIIEAEEWMYQSKLTESKSITSSIISSLRRVLSEKSIETKEHTRRTNILALRLGKSLNLSENELAELSLLSTLHDIGKVAIPEKILLKQTGLTESDWKIIKKHPQIGYNIIRYSPHLAHTANAVLAHHEWWDGSGYPQKLKGENIPATARILSVVDAYDVMVNGRPYKNKIDNDSVIKELKNGAGNQFDPVIIKKFLEMLSENISLSEEEFSYKKTLPEWLQAD